MIRKIPSTMVSQHPDHASKPYWHTEEFIGTQHEARECFLSFSHLGTSEYKWDWEGKFVDESIIERLLGEYFQFFKKEQLGKEKFLTLRLPNPSVETEFRLGRAFMSILGAAGLAKQIGLHSPPLFEVILPMTELAEEMIGVQEAFREMAMLKHPLHNFKNGALKHIEIIPLFEQVSTIMRSHCILEKYIALHQKRFGNSPTYVRPYLARSDPALNSGLIPTVLAIKIALSHYRRFENKTSIYLYPIIGSASLPFRGGLTPDTIEQFTQEYSGIRTALLQSAFRYDYSNDKVIQAIKELERIIPQRQATMISSAKEKELHRIIGVFEKYYRGTVEELAPLINEVASFLPRRRERFQHIGLFGYSRGLGKVRLPRAIGFTAAMYSLGIPPEFIGVGRGLENIRKEGLLETLEEYYLHVKVDLKRAGLFVNKPLIEKLAKKEFVWSEILSDLKLTESYLGVELGPQKAGDFEHQRLTSTIYSKVKGGHKVIPEIEKAAILRKSMG